ncbi:MAG: tungstate transport system substrate-binding protein, partial [Bacteroidetes bacterium]
IVLEDPGDLMNQYTIIAVNPEKHEGINKKSAEAFVKWITSDKALKMIDEFGRHKFGESLFRVNYSK